jgi:uncharacterized coiled-coil protein SlyX
MEPATEQLIDLEVKLAYQERLIGELDELVRGFATRLEAAERELRALKAAVAPPTPIGPQHEPPPHY